MGILDYYDLFRSAGYEKSSSTIFVLPGSASFGVADFNISVAFIAIDNIATTTGPSNTISASIPSSIINAGGSITKIAEYTLGGSAAAGVTLAAFLITSPKVNAYSDITFTFSAATVAKAALQYQFRYSSASAPASPSAEAYSFSTGTAANLSTSVSGLKANRDKLLFFARGYEGPDTDGDAATATTSPPYSFGVIFVIGTSGGGAASNMSLIYPSQPVKSPAADSVTDFSVTSTLEASRDSVQVILSIVDGITRLQADLRGTSVVTPMLRLDPNMLKADLRSIGVLDGAASVMLGPNHVHDGLDLWVRNVPAPSVTVSGRDFSKWMRDQPVHGLWPTDLPPKVLTVYLAAIGASISRYVQQAQKHALAAMTAMSRSKMSGLPFMVRELFLSGYVSAKLSVEVLTSRLRSVGSTASSALNQSSIGSALRTAVMSAYTLGLHRISPRRLTGVLAPVRHRLVYLVRTFVSLAHVILPGWIAVSRQHLSIMATAVDVSARSSVSYRRAPAASEVGRVQRVDVHAIRG